MRKDSYIWIFPFVLIGLVFLFFSACEPALKIDDLPKDAVVGSATDIDGNVYRTIKIGTQTWMVENLKTSKYNDGTEISDVTDSAKWRSSTTGAYCKYENDASNASKYGKLYNWYAVNDSRKIAPAGWHIASSAEWQILENYLIANGYNYDGTTSNNKIAKSLAATSGWNKNTGEGIIGNDLSKNNSSGFSAFPSGVRYPGGAFLYKGNYTVWWASDQYNVQQAYIFGLGSITPELINNYNNKAYGYSVRCIKDNATIITTTAASAISKTMAVSGGNVISDDGVTITSRGVCWNTATNPTIANSKTTDGSGLGVFTSSITGLVSNTTYYVRAYATNVKGTVYGDEISFKTTTVSGVPTLTTAEATQITESGATCGGNVISDDGDPVTARGICWSLTSSPIVSNFKTSDYSGTGLYTSYLTNLLPNTTYYVRAYATNSAGTGYGNEISLTTKSVIYSTVSDIEGNIYKTVTIGSQTWMAENLRTTRYRDNTVIPNVKDTAWGRLTTGIYCDYNNDASMGAKYGKLYNWYVVNDSRNIAPIGWHVPSNQEWTTLINYLGGENWAGGKLKEAGTLNWLSPNTGGTNESGFTALPAGIRPESGLYTSNLGSDGLWWTSTVYGNYAYRWGVKAYNSAATNSGYLSSKQSGLSIRCIKD